MNKSYCEFCKKELSEEKLETLHGCLDCSGSIYLNQKCDKEICIHCIEIENEKLKAKNRELMSKLSRYCGDS